MAIEVVAYDPRWPAWYAELELRYRMALRQVPVLAIEHVGSTSVPGLAAKPIIDVDIVVERGDVADASAALEALGYVPLGELGIPDRWAFRAPAERIATNTYVTVAGCLSLRNHLAVRDTLRAHAPLRDEYAVVKRQLALQVDSIDAYIAGKSEVLQKVLARAGFADEELRRVDGINRHVRIREYREGDAPALRGGVPFVRARARAR